MPNRLQIALEFVRETMLVLACYPHFIYRMQ